MDPTTGQKKAADNSVTCFECKKPGHYKNECPELQKGRMPKELHKGKKILMATWDDSESEEEDYEEEQAAFALMARTDEGPEEKRPSEADSNSDEEDEVHSYFSYPELKSCLLEIIKEHNSLLI